MMLSPTESFVRLENEHACAGSLQTATDHNPRYGDLDRYAGSRLALGGSKKSAIDRGCLVQPVRRSSHAESAALHMPILQENVI